MKKLAIIVLAFAFSSVILPQHEDQISETQSNVPELSAYHKVIYPMWHKAYPNKDYELFRKLRPDINSGAEKVYSAKLPGILRDKQGEWEKGVEKLRSSVERFNKAADENNEQEMLASAEVLHTNYEGLVRIIKPVTKEVDEFHKVLYMIYHHYGPEKNTAELNSAIDTLVLRAEVLKSSTLPKWAADKQESFAKVSGELYDSVVDLQKNKNTDKVNKAIEKVHSNYQKVEALFD